MVGWFIGRGEARMVRMRYVYLRGRESLSVFIAKDDRTSECRRAKFFDLLFEHADRD